MADYLGDFTTGKTIHHKFMTVNASGKPTTLGDSPSLLLYVNSSVSGVASGLTLTTDFDSKTGLNHVQFLATTSVTGVTSATECQIVIATGSVSAVSLAGFPICDFSLMNRSALRPATADRTLLVSTTGYAGIDWNQIGTPGATVSLSATTLFTTSNVTNTVPANVTAASTNIGAVVTASNINIGAIVTASNINIGAVVTAVNTVVPARVTAQGIDIGAIVTAISTIAPARVTAQGINIGAIVTAFNTIAPANVTASSINIGAIVTACSTVVPANVTSISASGLADLFLINSGTNYAASVTGSPVKEIADNAGGASLTVGAIVSGVWEAKQTASGTVAGSFGQYLDITTSSRLAPAVSGRTLLVSSTGYGGIDWNSIGTPGATVNLAATTLFTAANATNVTNNVGAVVTACNTVVPANVTAASIDIGAIVTACNTVVPANVTAASINVGAVVTAVNTVVPARVTSVAATVLGTIGGAAWDAVLADHLGAGSTGEALNAAGGAGDPWITPLPGAYVTGQAGNILGEVVQAAVSAIQAKVTGLAFTIAGQVDANVKSVTDITITGTGTAVDPWGP